MQIKVLVVDDNKNNLLLEKDLLELAGFEVLEAENGTSGIAIAIRERPDVIIMDVRLPDIRGTDAAKMIRQNEATNNIPVVFVTASVTNEGMQELSSINNSRSIGKPINTRTFVDDIRQFYFDSRK